MISTSVADFDSTSGVDDWTVTGLEFATPTAANSTAGSADVSPAAD